MKRRGAAISVATTTAILALALTACAQMAPYVPTDPNTAPVGGALTSSGPLTSASSAAPAPATTTGSPTPPAQVSAAAKATKAQLGIQIYWHDVDDAAAAKADADRLLDYVVGLGANSVSISFPFYTDGVDPTKVYTTAGKTPSPATVRVFLDEAKARGLRAMVRPILDETNLIDAKSDWRGSIRPVSTSAWFASYQKLLDPYLDVAQTAHADGFVVGTELDSLVPDTANWKTLLSASRERFSGELGYADNWDKWATGKVGVSGTALGLDAYPQLGASDSTSLAKLTTAWTAWLQHKPASVLSQTVLQEVGIAATSGAYSNPVQWEVAGQTVDPQIQIKWFAAACSAARSERMAGIYFWDLDVYADPTQGATYGTGSFIGRGDQSIKACYATGWPGQ